MASALHRTSVFRPDLHHLFHSILYFDEHHSSLLLVLKHGDCPLSESFKTLPMANVPQEPTTRNFPKDCACKKVAVIFPSLGYIQKATGSTEAFIKKTQHNTTGRTIRQFEYAQIHFAHFYLLINYERPGRKQIRSDSLLFELPLLSTHGT